MMGWLKDKNVSLTRIENTILIKTIKLNLLKLWNILQKLCVYLKGKYKKWILK